MFLLAVLWEIRSSKGGAETSDSRSTSLTIAKAWVSVLKKRLLWPAQPTSCYNVERASTAALHFVAANEIGSDAVDCCVCVCACVPMQFVVFALVINTKMLSTMVVVTYSTITTAVLGLSSMSYEAQILEDLSDKITNMTESYGYP